MKRILLTFLLTFSLLTISSVGNAQQLDFEKSLKFKDYQSLFSYIAKDVGISESPDNAIITKLAAESTVDFGFTVDGKRLYVITANYITTVKTDYGLAPVNSIRGASNNGAFYVVEPVKDELQLVGVLGGNGYYVANVEGEGQIVTNWHTSAVEYSKTYYQRKKDVFKKVKVEVVKAVTK